MNKKPKNPEIELIIAMAFCLILGLTLIGFALRAYLRYDQAMPTTIDGQGADSALIWGQAQLLRLLLYQATPACGGAFLFVGFIIWNYRRKKRFLKDTHEPDA